MIISFIKKLLSFINYTVITLTIFIVSFFIILEIYCVSSDKQYMKSEKFDSTVWKEDGIYQASMLYDLKNNYLRVGMPIQAVKDLLGEDFTIRKYRRWCYKGDCLNYECGTIGTFIHDNYELIICPDSSGEKVHHYKIFRITPWGQFFDGGKNIYPEYPSYIQYNY
jgi:hypothetical protein